MLQFRHERQTLANFELMQCLIFRGCICLHFLGLPVFPFKSSKKVVVGVLEGYSCHLTLYPTHQFQLFILKYYTKASLQLWYDITKVSITAHYYYIISGSDLSSGMTDSLKSLSVGWGTLFFEKIIRPQHLNPKCLILHSKVMFSSFQSYEHNIKHQKSKNRQTSQLSNLQLKQSCF